MINSLYQAITVVLVWSTLQDLNIALKLPDVEANEPESTTSRPGEDSNAALPIEVPGSFNIQGSSSGLPDFLNNQTFKLKSASQPDSNEPEPDGNSGKPNLNTGPNTFPGFMFNFGGQTANSDAESSQNSTGATDPDSPFAGIKFEFPRNQGGSTGHGENVSSVHSPSPVLPPNGHTVFSLAVLFCGDLCKLHKEKCSGDDMCELMNNCSVVCHRSNGSQALLKIDDDNDDDNERKLRPEIERHCYLSGRLCVHGMCKDGKNCTCDVGYEGDLCADKQCELPFCKHGICNKTDATHYVCACYEGWGGIQCDKPACTLPCVHGGCKYRPGEEQTYCNCQYGWQGQLCEEETPDPAVLAKKEIIMVSVIVPVICFLAVILSGYVLWRKRVIFIFKIINIFKAYEDDDNKEFDAYVSLTEADYDFVRRALQPKLEEMGYKIYLHARDGAAGEVRSETILEAVEKSRRCILLLSYDYLNNEWCRFEYLIAQHETCIKLKQRIIPILLDDIDKDKRQTMDKTLRFIVDSVKCLRYPTPLNKSAVNRVASNVDPESGCVKTKDEVRFEKKLAAFWERLSLNMPKKRSKTAEEPPSIADSPMPLVSDKNNSNSNKKTNGFRKYFDSFAKSSRKDMVAIASVSISEKSGEMDSVTLGIGKPSENSKLDSFYHGTLEKNLNSSLSGSSFVGEDTPERIVNVADVHVND
ncbi:protein toll [Plakobranchus ocellatus]|uniref:Protein toll n=1 Tax=Plakobranchus ocellatus TaxID=259542 RepID=A0AAV4CZD2_9GAST|nr:protein toll [Plakobranchus ocellatus]